MSEPLLELQGIAAGYGSLQILFDVNLRVERGEQVLVFGPNGAGKSTLMKALIGLLTPTAGRVMLLGQDLSGQGAETIVEKGLGYVPQLDNVFASLSVEENLDMGALLVKGDKRARLAAMYERFPVLADKRRQRAGTLSGGQRQMLAMARALIAEPQLLLLDEPTAGLAPQMVSEMFATIGEISAAGTSVLMVEQNAKQALAYADRGYVMENGRVRFEGPAAELLAREDIGQLYLGARGGTAKSMSE